jgi:lipopolysaccharide transport system ATP-binding protein
MLCGRGIILDRGSIVFDDAMTRAIPAYLQTISKTAQGDVSARTDRTGDGQVRLVKLEVGSGDKCESIMTGGSLRLVFQLSDHSLPITCTFTIYNHLGMAIAAFDSSKTGAHDVHHARHGRLLICALERVMLMPGDYRINVAIRSPGCLHDHVEGAAAFVVHPGLLDGRPVGSVVSNTSVCFPHRWATS